MFICIEPLVQLKDNKIIVLEDGWTVASKNRNLNAHFEHTIKIGEKEVEILTEYE
jgi:methionyl aminopeptidase